MERKVLKLKDRQRQNSSYSGSKEGGIESVIIRHFLVKAGEANYVQHDIDSANQMADPVGYIWHLDQVIATLEKKEPDWYIVRVITNPLISPIEIFNTRKDLVQDISPERKKDYADRAYEGVRDVLRKGQYVVHRFINDVVAFEELYKRQGSAK